jgi:hypothetical protein
MGRCRQITASVYVKTWRVVNNHKFHWLMLWLSQKKNCWFALEAEVTHGTTLCSKLSLIIRRKTPTTIVYTLHSAIHFKCQQGLDQRKARTRVSWFGCLSTCFPGRWKRVKCLTHIKQLDFTLPLINSSLIFVCIFATNLNPSHTICI